MIIEDIIISKAVPQICERLKTIENNRKYISYLIEKRFTNERMLQLEILNIISQMPEVEDYLPEMPYDLQGKEKCDLWFSLKDGSEYWIELKMRPTDYRKKGHAKAITHGINGITEDINRLKKVRGKKFTCLQFIRFIQKIIPYLIISTYKKSQKILKRQKYH